MVNHSLINQFELHLKCRIHPFFSGKFVLSLRHSDGHNLLVVITYAYLLYTNIESKSRSNHQTQ
ncbi:hypothetical protein DERF_009403 [Dermatophagoides farinae]|uniref:Uncharacterized protein n=1 Tax=Dermatophagoides farinae TaxID=6954 RepID=A0A922HWW0_DERFA|nr:hypothetical protein DERF_009403 [Dermatophagoides farinae]